MVKKEIERTEISPDTLSRQIKARMAELKQVLIEKEKSLENAPEGTLRVDRKRNSLQYYHRYNPAKPKGVYLKRAQNSFAAALVQKDYDFKLVRELRTEIKTLDRFLEKYRPEKINEIFTSFHNDRKSLICPSMLPDEDYVRRWMSVEYERKPFGENAPEFFTANGERVRSKSELLIADALRRFHIPYRYEYPIHICGIGAVHPDFTCLNVRKRKSYLWEHNGMMSDPDYAVYAIKKFEMYALAGYHPGENLIFSFESSFHPLSSRTVECNIKRFLV